MRRNRRLSAGIVLLSLAVVAATVVPAFGQRRGPFGGDRGGPGMAPGEERRGPFGGEGGGPGMMRGGSGMPGGEGRGPGMMMRGGSGMPGGEGRGPGMMRGGSGMPGGEGRGPGMMRGSSGTPGGDSSAERFANALREMDTDRDGRVEENEVEGRRRFFVEMMARRAGIEPKFPMSVSKLEEGLAKSAERGRSEDSEQKKTAEPLVPGFGVEMDLPPLLNFGERAEAASSDNPRSSTQSGSRDSSSRDRPSRDSSSSRESSSQGGDDRVRRMAEIMMRQADKNGNQRLERDEWNDRWGEFRDADRNRDGVVRADEMARRLGEYSQNRSRSDGSSSSASKGSSYRFRTAIDLLPEGLPDWFAQKDANADGQVAMAEFESPGSWTSVTAAQFVRYDLNNDGVVTPTECIAVMEQPESDSTAASADVASQVARTSPGTSPGSQAPVSANRESSSSSTSSSTSGGAWEGF